jgi:hypothetical protein
MRSILCLVLLAQSLQLIAEEERTLRTYEITDLIQGTGDRPVPAATGRSGESVPGPAPVAPERAPALDDILRRWFDPAMAALICEQGGMIGKTTLVLNAAPGAHQQVAEVLAKARHAVHSVVEMETHLFLMPPHIRHGDFAFPEFSWKPLPERPGMSFAVLSPEDIRKVKEDLSGFPDDEARGFFRSQTTSTAPIGQCVETGFITQQAYLPVAFPETPGGRVEFLHLGDRFRSRAVPTPDQRSIEIDFEHQRCALLRMEVVELDGDRSREVPVLWHGGEHVRHSIPLGHSLIIATGVYLGGETPVTGFLLLTPELRDADGTIVTPAAVPAAR